MGRRGPVLLVLLGLALVGSGLAMTTVAPRAVSTDIGPSITIYPAGPVGATPSTVPATPSPTVDVGEVSPAEPVSLTLRGEHPVPVVPVGVLRNGALQLPERPTTLGWYAAGAAPGDRNGTIVIAGHVDSAVYGAGPLIQLPALHLGDTLQLADASGSVHRYTVVSRRSYFKAGLPKQVFRQDGPAQLAVITCGGAFDRQTHNYADNVVVLAAPA